MLSSFKLDKCTKYDEISKAMRQTCSAKKNRGRGKSIQQQDVNLLPKWEGGEPKGQSVASAFARAAGKKV